MIIYRYTKNYEENEKLKIYGAGLGDYISDVKDISDNCIGALNFSVEQLVAMGYAEEVFPEYFKITLTKGEAAERFAGSTASELLDDMRRFVIIDVDKAIDENIDEIKIDSIAEYNDWANEMSDKFDHRVLES